MQQSNSTSANNQGSRTYTPPSRNLIDTAFATGHFTSLLAGIRAAGLTDTFTGKGPFTVFAPTDEAFKKLPAGAMEALLKDTVKLRAVLNYHVIKGHVLAKDMTSGNVSTLQGSPLMAVVSPTGMQVNGAHVKQADIEATNGVIHVIDAVIMPKDWQLLAAAA
jgi:uncharacterized surface protein with fasciclin (FAS1) repeats